jgi:RNA polymerase sigma-70 factor (ECF subfamily)
MRVARSDKHIEEMATRMLYLEEEAFIEFAKIFGPRLKAFFLKRGLSAGDAEDLSVSCVTDISLKVNKYTALREGGFTSWVFALAHNSLVDWWRNRRVTEPLPENLSAPALPDDQGDDEHVAGIVTAVRQALALLADSDRSVIILRELEGNYTYDEIAGRLGMRAEAARVRHHRALKKLKAILEADPRIVKFLSRHRDREHEEI